VKAPRFSASTLTPDIVSAAMHSAGCMIVEEALPEGYLRGAVPELESAIAQEARWHGTTDYQDYGMVLICSLYGGAFWNLFDLTSVTMPFETVLGEGCIVYAYTSSSMPPGRRNYSSRIHVDCPRLIPGYVTNMGATILLSDFTEENGATWFLPKSHERPEAPSDEEFFRRSERLVAPKGSIFFFNARTWHMGGSNTTDQWRHALTINMCRSYMRQRIDIPRAMSHMNLERLSPKAAQKLGFDVQIPTSMEEYYQPPEKRKFRQRTE
jgi:ectoine hydroxylase-related dioxygenase (phytanoyl-CoA dioxygenase family)